MQEFFMDYGLWLLIGLLVIIGLIFLLSGRRKTAEDVPVETFAAVEEAAVSPAVVPPASTTIPLAETIAPVAAPPVEERVAPTAAPVPASPSVTAPPEEGDNLLKLKGVGPKLNQLLIELGVTRYAQIAGWSDADIAAIDARLGNFKGRPVRDQWVDQARYLAAGDIAGFEAKYGKV